MTKIIVVAMLVLVGTASAEVPHFLNYQGRITDDSGAPSDGPHALTFRIYDDSTGGTTLWTETHSGVTVTDGLFDVILGSIEAIEASVFSNQARWLGITVDLGSELHPRTQILAVAYAYRAEYADTASFAHGGGGWVDDGSTVRLSWGSDSVGIGTGDPAERLHVNGDVRLGSGSDIAFGNDDTRLYGSSGDLLMTADDDIFLRPDDDVFIRRDGGSDWVHFDNSTEKVGIGITNPPYKLTVNGELSIANSGESKFHINYYNNGLNFAETGVSDRRLHIGIGGNVGIGTAEPGAKFGVNGDAKITSDLQVNGAFKGDISSASGSDGAPFPRPAYNSDWLPIEKDETMTLTHGVGGNADNYFVDLQMRASTLQINSLYYGGEDSYTSGVERYKGAFYFDLDTSIIKVKRRADDSYSQEIRIRIWVIE